MKRDFQSCYALQRLCSGPYGKGGTSDSLEDYPSLYPTDLLRILASVQNERTLKDQLCLPCRHTILTAAEQFKSIEQSVRTVGVSGKKCQARLGSQVSSKALIVGANNAHLMGP